MNTIPSNENSEMVTFTKRNSLHFKIVTRRYLSGQGQFRVLRLHNDSYFSAIIYVGQFFFQIMHSVILLRSQICWNGFFCNRRNDIQVGSSDSCLDILFAYSGSFSKLADLFGELRLALFVSEGLFWVDLSGPSLTRNVISSFPQTYVGASH